MSDPTPLPEPRAIAGLWGLKVYDADQLRTYGDAREAAGYQRALEDAAQYVESTWPLRTQGEVAAAIRAMKGQP